MGEAGMKPLRLEPVYKASIWAGDRLSRIRGLKEPGIGIAREVCAYRGSENRIRDGEYAGRSIGELIQEEAPRLMGEDASGQLVRVAYIDAREDLSVQVHPGEAQARAVGDYEKSEAWYILEAGEGASIIAGVNTTDRERLRQAAQDGSLDACLVRHPVQAGDVALIPAGMVHACGGDMLALEVGSFGGITYRLYDYGRGRSLDLEESFQTLDASLSCKIGHFQEKKANKIQSAIRHTLFSADIIDVEDIFTILPQGKYYILTCVEGSCRVCAMGAEEPLSYTETLLIPASCGEVVIKGKARLFRSCRS